MAEEDADPAPAPFRVPIFRAMWLANMVSNFGSLIQSVGAAWLMTTLSHSPIMVTLVQSSTTLPIMLLSLFAGAMADNLNRRRVMIASQSFMLVASFVLVGCAWGGLLSPVLLLAFTFAIGCGTAINAPSAAALVGDMVPRGTLPAAVALNSMGFNIARSAGPAVGGLIVAATGAGAAFLVNAISYVGVIGVLTRWRPVRPETTLPREAMASALRGGLSYVAMSPHLRVVMVRAGLFGIFASGVSALMPLIARDVLHGNAGTYGMLSASFGVGAVGGALVMTRIRGRLSSENVARLAALALAGGTAIIGLSGFLPFTLVALVLAGGGWVIGLATFNILVQMASPRWVVGRALSCYQMFAFGAMAAGSWIIGVMTEHFGVIETLWLIAALQGANLLYGFVLPLEDVGALNLDPVSASFEPQTALPVSPRSGPVVIETTYRIAPEDVPGFLAAMLECRRIRRRDGASGWTLMRDLGDEERWVERFHVPTWIDYLRHIRRRTHADMAARDEVAKFHIGPDRPLVTRMLERQPLPPPAVSEPLVDPAMV